MDTIALLDVSSLTYPQQLAAASLQGLANREGPCLYLDWGIYDDVRTRTTNEVFLPEEIWQAKYRTYVGDSDLLNLAHYRETYGYGYVPNAAQTDHALLGIRLFFGVVPAVVLILSLPLLFWYPITRASHARLRAQLEGKE